jgi:hypothetical protein
MADLHAGFRSFDRLPAPDLWADIERRAGTISVTEPLIGQRPRWVAFGGGPAPTRRALLVTGVVLLAVVLGLAWAGGLLRLVMPPPISTQMPNPTPFQAATAGPTEPPASAPGNPPGLILLNSVGGVTEHLWLTSPDGTDLHQFSARGGLTGVTQFGGNWWPDGRRLLLLGGFGTYIGNPDGTDVRGVTDADWSDVPGGETEALSHGREGWPNWSPDRTQLVTFEPVRNIGPSVAGTQAFILDLATGARRNLPVPTELCVGDLHWSPDGSAIVMTTGRPPVTGYPCKGVAMGDHDIYVIHADGTGLTQLTNDHQSAWASWTPDGRLVFFHAGGLWVMRADGTGQVPLSPLLADLSTVSGPAEPGVAWGIHASWQPMP